MYLRTLQGYEEALGVAAVNSYVPALKTMWGFGDLYAELNQKQSAKAMYERAMAGFAAVRGSSSNTCKSIQSRLEALDLLIKN